MTTINEWREYSTTVLAHKRYCKTWYRLTTAMSHQAQPKCYCSDRIEGDNASPNRWPGAPHLLPRVPSLTAVVPASSTPKLKDSCPSAPTPPPPTLSSPLASPPHGQIESPHSIVVSALSMSSAPRGRPPPSTRPRSHRPHRCAPPRLLRPGELRCLEVNRPRSSSHGSAHLPPASRRPCSRVDARLHEFAAHLDVNVQEKEICHRVCVTPTGRFFSEGAGRSGRPLLQLLHGGPCRVSVPQSAMLLPMPGVRTSGQGLFLPSPLYELSSRWFSRQRPASTSAICPLASPPTWVGAQNVVAFAIFGPSSLIGVLLYRGAGLASPV
jgi:hypothetical protein